MDIRKSSDKTLSFRLTDDDDYDNNNNNKYGG
jgi:hypothetical protein